METSGEMAASTVASSACGIGARVFLQGDVIRVQSVHINGPAFRLLEVGDVIIEIDVAGVDPTFMLSVTGDVDLLGAAGSEVVIKLSRKGSLYPAKVVLQRQPFDETVFAGAQTPTGDDVGHSGWISQSPCKLYKGLFEAAHKLPWQSSQREGYMNDFDFDSMRELHALRLMLGATCTDFPITQNDEIEYFRSYPSLLHHTGTCGSDDFLHAPVFRDLPQNGRRSPRSTLFCSLMQDGYYRPESDGPPCPFRDDEPLSDSVEADVLSNSLHLVGDTYYTNQGVVPVASYREMCDILSEKGASGALRHLLDTGSARDHDAVELYVKSICWDPNVREELMAVVAQHFADGHSSTSTALNAAISEIEDEYLADERVSEAACDLQYALKRLQDGMETYKHIVYKVFRFRQSMGIFSTLACKLCAILLEVTCSPNPRICSPSASYYAGTCYMPSSSRTSLALRNRLHISCRGGILQVLANKLTKLPCHFRAISHGRQCITKRVCNQSFCDVFTEAQVQQNVQHWIDRLDDGSERFSQRSSWLLLEQADKPFAYGFSDEAMSQLELAADVEHKIQELEDMHQDLADDLSMDIEELYLAQDNDSCDIEYENCNPDHQDEDDEAIPCSAPEQGVSSIFCDSEGQACQKLVGLKRKYLEMAKELVPAFKQYDQEPNEGLEDTHNLHPKLNAFRQAKRILEHQEKVAGERCNDWDFQDIEKEFEEIFNLHPKLKRLRSRELSSSSIGDIMKEQNLFSTDLIIDNTAFASLCSEIAQDFMSDIPFDVEALLALQTVAEDFLVQTFEGACMNAVADFREEILPRDMHLALQHRKTMWCPL